MYGMVWDVVIQWQWLDTCENNLAGFCYESSTRTFLTLRAGRKPLVGLRGASSIPLSPHGNDWGDTHLNHRHMEKG